MKLMGIMVVCSISIVFKRAMFSKTILILFLALLLVFNLPVSTTFAVKVGPKSSKRSLLTNLPQELESYCDYIYQTSPSGFHPPLSECKALEALYESTNGPGWSNNDGWMVTTEPCWWYGVSCNTLYNPHIVWLDLHYNHLNGVLPAEIGNLSGLTELVLTGNQLTGSLPSELSEVENLRYLALGMNQFTGAIPTEIGNLIDLTVLSLHMNQLSGEIPVSLTNLVNLLILNLGFNALYTNNPLLGEFLDGRSTGWANTQTVAPTELSVSTISPTQYEVSWNPINYTEGAGFYEISHSSTIDGQFIVVGHTADKSSSSIAITGLMPGNTYYIRVRTYSAADWLDPPEIWSEPTNHVTITMPRPMYMPIICHRIR